MKVKVANFFGGFPIKQHKDMLKTDCPHIIVGTPGRLKQVRSFRNCGCTWCGAALLRAAPGRHAPQRLTPSCALVQLVKEGNLKLGSVRHFIIDECDKVLDSMGEHSQPASAAGQPCASGAECPLTRAPWARRADVGCAPAQTCGRTCRRSSRRRRTTSRS